MPDATYVELFAGAGGLSMGVDRAGWSCLAHAEINPDARAVLAARWPGVALYGDVAQLDGAELARVHGTPLLLSGGSPCQDLSVAGKRAGLAGARSGLFHEQVRLWHETGALYFLWENVLGALSSNRGADFAAVLSAVVGAPVPVPEGGWASAGVVAGPRGVATWRCLDAQWFGVPQRRRRVFVLGARAGGVDPAEVLLEPEGVPRDPPTRGEAGEGAAAGARRGATLAFTKNDSGNDVSEDIAPTLRAGQHAASHANGGVTPAVVAFHHTQDPISGPSAPCLGAEGMGVLAFDTTQITSPLNYSSPRAGDTDHPLAASGHVPAIAGVLQSCYRGVPSTEEVLAGQVVVDSVPDIAATLTGAGKGKGWDSDPSTGTFVVTVGGDVTHALTHEGHDASEDGTGRGTPIIAPTLSPGAHPGGFNGQDVGQVAAAIAAGAGIPRRLTPRECERLMGWPDDWTLVPNAKGKPMSDAARYRLCGNGVVSTVAQWIGWRLLTLHEAMVAAEQERAA